MTSKHLRTLLPDSLFDQLITIRDSISRDQWSIGEIDSNLCAMLDDQGWRDERGELYTHEHIHRLVGEFVGLRSSRVRHCAACYRYYSDDQRAEYSVLPFSHFEYAMQFPELTIDILECSIRRMDEIGRPPSVEWLEDEFRDPIRAFQAHGMAETVPIGSSYDEPDITQEENPLAYIDQDPTPVYADQPYYIGLLERGINTLRGIVERMSLPGETKHRIAELLESVIREIAGMTVEVGEKR